MRNWGIAVRALRLMLRYPLRAGLLVLSAVLSVSGVVCSLNYAAGGTQKVLDQIRRLGTNVLIVTPAESRSVAGRARTGIAVTTLVERDYTAIKREVLARRRSSAFVTRSFWNKAGDLSKNATIVGCEPDYFAIKDWTTDAGEMFDVTEERTAARVAVVGRTVALDLFGVSSPLGQRIMLNRVPFTIIGVLRERGQGLDVSNEDDQIYVPLRTALRRLMNTDHYSGILVEIDDLSHMDEDAAQIRRLLQQSHHILVNQPEDFQIQNQKTLLDTQRVASRRLGFFLAWIAMSALLVSGLGIAAITWIAVRERTREIGTRRALGATAADVFLQIQLESGVLGVLGGLLGMALAWPLSLLLSSRSGLPFVFNAKEAGLVFAIAATSNLLFSLLSASKAATISPLDALRYE